MSGKAELLPAETPRPPTRLERHLAERVRRAWHGGVEMFVLCGEVLIEAKAALPHGRWQPWVEDQLPFGPASARQIMRIARDNNVRRYVGKGPLDGPPVAEIKRQPANVLPVDRTALDALCGLEPETFDVLVERGAIHAEMRRADVKPALAQLSFDTAPVPAPAPALASAAGYGAIHADPPWAFEAYGNGGHARAAEAHYPTMSDAEIATLEIGRKGVIEIAAADCTLFVWVPASHLRRGLDLIYAWGFDFRTVGFVWRKTGAPGLGYWTRKQTELCLLATRGKPKRLAADVGELIEAPRGPHSAKPEEALARIERLVGGPYLDLFGRRDRPGWDRWCRDASAEGAE